MADNIITPEFRASYAHILKPAPAKPGFNSKFQITMLFKKNENIQALKDAAVGCLVEKFGSDQAKWPKNLRNPFRDQAEKEQPGYEPGAIFITATSNQRPGLVDANVQDIIEEREFYSGCYARASLRPFYYDQAGNRGVSFGLQNVQKLREGEPLGGRSRPADDFQPVDVAGSNAPAAASVFG